ncbi:hypothetical protein D9M68_986800 [compost metagenome]
MLCHTRLLVNTLSSTWRVSMAATWVTLPPACTCSTLPTPPRMTEPSMKASPPTLRRTAPEPASMFVTMAVRVESMWVSVRSASWVALW